LGRGGGGEGGSPKSEEERKKKRKKKKKKRKQGKKGNEGGTTNGRKRRVDKKKKKKKEEMGRDDHFTNPPAWVSPLLVAILFQTVTFFSFTGVTRGGKDNIEKKSGSLRFGKKGGRSSFVKNQAQGFGGHLKGREGWGRLN